MATKDRPRLERLMRDVDMLLADDTGAERLVRRGESYVRRINDALFDAKLPLSVSLDRKARTLVFTPISIDDRRLDHVVCHIEDVATIVVTKEKNTP